MPPRLQLLVCQNLEREVAAVLKSEGLEEVGVATTPARCHGPSLAGEQPTVPEGADAGKGDGGRTCVVGCNILKGSLPAPTGPRAGLGAGSDQCFELLIGRPYTEHLIREGAYLLTPGWLAHWRRYIDYWGFDQKTAREFFAESTTSVVLLDTGVDSQSSEFLQEFAEFVARPARTIPVGLSCFRLYLLNLMMEERSAAAGVSAKTGLAEAQRKLGDYAMVYDLMGRLTSMDSEGHVIESVFELFTMLFAPTRLLHVPLTEGIPGTARSIPTSAAGDPSAIRRLTELRGECVQTESARGFILRIGEQDETVGVLEVEGIAFPQYLAHYVNLSMSLARVCGLAIRNARTYEKLEHNVAELREALANVKTLSGLLPICAWCHKIRSDEGYWSQLESYVAAHSQARFSHGICPECQRKHFSSIPTSNPDAPG
jgi:hypothetical protein